MERRKIKLTKTVVERLLPREEDYIVWDSEITGFAVRVYSSGTKALFYQYRNQYGKMRRYTIGKLSAGLTVEQARKRAKELALEVFAGKDPQEQREVNRHALTVNELLDLYVQSEKFRSNSPSTQATDRGRIDRHLRPLLGREIAERLTAEKIVKAQRAITEGKTAATVKTKPRGLARVRGGAGTAAKAVLLLKAVYSWALKNGLVKSNPAAEIRVPPAGVRETVITSPDEYARLFATLDRMENEHRIRRPAADAIRVIALTGARRGEIVNLIWRWVDLKTSTIAIPSSNHKTGKATGKPRIIALPAAAKAIIARQPPGAPDDLVFRPAKGSGHLSLGKVWRKVRDEAGLPPSLGLHGLRHSIGTNLAMSGASSFELMEVLGHKQVSTTMRYVHFAQSARSALAERAAAVAVAGMTDTPKAEVIELKREGTNA